MANQFASLSASLLARKGEAKPSQEPVFGSKPWQPPVVPAQQPQPRPPVAPLSAAAASMPVAAPAPVAALTSAALAPAEAKVRLSEVDAVWPTPKPVHTVEVDEAGWRPARDVQPATPVNPNAPVKTTIRLTHAQVRAVKLAALLLDRPQQEIVTAGLIGRLEAIACSDLANCNCFKAVMEGLKLPEPAAELPLAY